MGRIKFVAAIFATCLLAACATPARRTEEAKDSVAKAGWTWAVLRGGDFDLATASSPVTGPRLVVYIEGDGLAWIDRHTPSSNPTPAPPTALKLALTHSGGPVAYLARPCQFTMPEHGRNCTRAVWTSRRTAPEVVDSANLVIDALERRAGARRVVLVGYSGGGALAVLLAARRTDVDGIVTVAADLDIGYWTRRDHLSPLTGSLDPADAAEAVSRIPQVHFVGGDDEVVGRDVAASYLSHMADRSRARLVVIPDFTHTCCWAARWPALVARPELAIIPGWTASADSPRRDR